MSLQTRLAASLKRFVRRTGSTVTITDNTAQVFDPTTLGITGAAVAMVVQATAPSPFEARLAEGENVAIGDVQMFIQADDPALLTPPLAGMEVILNSEVYALVAVRTMEANGTAYGYDLHMRGRQ